MEKIFGMDTKKFLLLDIDYITERNEAVIRLFGKLIGEENELSIIAKDRSFKSYIYVLPFDEEVCIKELNELELRRTSRRCR